MAGIRRAMKAIEMNGFNEMDRITTQDKPMPIPNEREVRIKIHFAGFNPVDTKIHRGWYGGDVQRILGFDCSGVVEAIGVNETKFAVGDQVYALAFRSLNGTYAEYVCVPDEFVTKKPDALSLEQAASVPLAAMTAYRATLAPSAIKKDDTVFIAGIGGGVGSFAAQFAKLADAKGIFTVAKDEQSAQAIMKNTGIPRENIVLYDGKTTQQLKEALLALNRGRFFDVTLDFIGAEMKDLCIDLTTYSGHMSSVVPEPKNRLPSSGKLSSSVVDALPHVWEQEATLRSRNITLHLVDIGAETAEEDRGYWKVYENHMNTISLLFQKGHIKAPLVRTVGRFDAKTVQEAFRLLIDGSVKGKLVMQVV